jgi:serine phosphatase RsbU (regulator of sigma subunit)
MNLARRIQQDLMDVPIPSLDFARIAVRYATSPNVGGDFYDIVLNNTSVAVFIADLSGKGIEVVCRESAPRHDAGCVAS